MTRLVAIVEGHGEVQAVPVLVRRIASAALPGVAVDVPRPIRVKRHRILKEGELERAIELAARQAGPDGRILVLLDADEECPKTLAENIRRRAAAVRGDRRICAVLAKTEYEAWFVAAVESIVGQRGIRRRSTSDNPEAISDAKGWLSNHMEGSRSYSEVLDQPALSAVFDLDLARKRSPSFDKMWRDVASLLAP
ncbi:MAG: DUF4276 family protein [Planctomycetes bacterium]|nr:DUF4276 family protein [Planctomycetota bacterium]